MGIKITSDNAEKIGRPLIESVLKAHLTSNYDLLIETIPGMKGKVPPEEFEHAAEDLLHLGNISSLEFITHVAKVKEHLLLWRVSHELADEDILWHLYLCDTGDKIKAVGLFYDL